jgi:hypothetical protein
MDPISKIIRLSWKFLLGTITLAYQSDPSVTMQAD